MCFLRKVNFHSRAHHVIVRDFSNQASTTSTRQALLKQLATLDTTSLCDADKTILAKSNDSSLHRGLQLLQGLTLLNNIHTNTTMVGSARTIQCTEPNDFLAVLQGLDQAEQDDVLVINTMNSSRAVAGELFCAEAARRGVRGIVVDGPMRDTAYLQEFPSVHCYSTLVTPYSGTIQAVGEMQVTVTCGGANVSPGDVVVGDKDGIVVGSADTFAQLLETAREIQKAEEAIKQGISEGIGLHSMTNFDDHVKARKAGQESTLTFRLPK